MSLKKDFKTFSKYTGRIRRAKRSLARQISLNRQTRRKKQNEQSTYKSNGTKIRIVSIISSFILLLFMLIMIFDKEARGEANLAVILTFFGVFLIVSLYFAFRPDYIGNPKCEDEEDCDDLHDVLENVDLMEGIEFEHYCARVLRRIGYTNVVVTSASGD